MLSPACLGRRGVGAVDGCALPHSGRRVNRLHQAVLLHAISDDAKRFDEKAGMTIALAEVEKALVAFG